MIQRIQTVFLLIAAVCTGVQAALHVEVPYIWILSVVMAAGSLTTIFLYQRRPLQSNLCAALMGLGIVYYIVIGFYQHKLQGQLLFTWPMVLTAVAIIFWFLARKRIVKDEKLVRSLDRIR